MTVDKGIFIKNIFYMLTYAFKELRANNYDHIASEAFDEIHDLFAEILSKGISYQLKQGLHREYVVRHDNLTTLRGKLDLNGTIRNLASQKKRLECEFDELSEDNLFNQILKTTVNILLTNAKVGATRKATLRRLMIFFENVSVIDLKTVRWNTLRFDRNSKTYQMLLYLCYFISQNLLMTTESGDYKMRTFSDEHMNMLFQRFVLEYYRKHFPKTQAHAGQIAWDCVEEDSSTELLPLMQTDIMLTLNDRTLIIDTKYYYQSLQVHFDKHTIHSANYYQIFTYVNSLDKKHTGKVDGMLLYAKTEEDIVPDGKQVQTDGNIIMFRTLDLNQDFEKIKKQLDALIVYPHS